MRKKIFLNNFLKLIRFPFSRLKPEQYADLALMRLHNNLSPNYFRPGKGLGWKKLVEEFDATFRFEGISDVEQQSFNARFAAYPPTNRAYYTIACNLMLLRLENRDKWGLLESLKATQKPRSRAHELELRGLVVTWDL